MMVLHLNSWWQDYSSRVSMRGPVLVVVLVVSLHTVRALPELGDLVERAKREVVMDTLSSGASPARRKRKATPFSRMMNVRNAVVRRAFEELSVVSLSQGKLGVFQCLVSD